MWMYTARWIEYRPTPSGRMRRWDVEYDFCLKNRTRVTRLVTLMARRHGYDPVIQTIRIRRWSFRTTMDEINRRKSA